MPWEKSIEFFLIQWMATVFVDTRLWKTKHPRKCFQHFRQSCALLRDRIEIHQLQQPVWPSNFLYVMLSGCVCWISIRSVNNKQDWRKFWKRFRRCFVFQSRVSTKTVVNQVKVDSKQMMRLTTHMHWLNMRVPVCLFMKITVYLHWFAALKNFPWEFC